MKATAGGGDAFGTDNAKEFRVEWCRRGAVDKSVKMSPEMMREALIAQYSQINAILLAYHIGSVMSSYGSVSSPTTAYSTQLAFVVEERTTFPTPIRAGKVGMNFENMVEICTGEAPSSPTHRKQIDEGFQKLQVLRRKRKRFRYSTTIEQLLNAGPDMMPRDGYRKRMGHMNLKTDVFPSDFPYKSAICNEVAALNSCRR